MYTTCFMWFFFSFLWFVHVFLQMRQEAILVCCENNLKGPTEGPVKAGGGCSVSRLRWQGSREPTHSSGSDAWEAFCITALHSYANDPAPEWAMSVAWMSKTRKNRKARCNIPLPSGRGPLALVILVLSQVPPVTQLLFANVVLDQILRLHWFTMRLYVLP